VLQRNAEAVCCPLIEQRKCQVAIHRRRRRRASARSPSRAAAQPQLQSVNRVSGCQRNRKVRQGGPKTLPAPKRQVVEARRVLQRNAEAVCCPLIEQRKCHVAIHRRRRRRTSARSPSPAAAQPQLQSVNRVSGCQRNRKVRQGGPKTLPAPIRQVVEARWCAPAERRSGGPGAIGPTPLYKATGMPSRSGKVSVEKPRIYGAGRVCSCGARSWCVVQSTPVSIRTSSTAPLLHGRR
jgi:hypothetical protein